MGLFDTVRCKLPLPWPEVQNVDWQSKNTPAQFLDYYEIREDGTLWHEVYDNRIERKNPHWLRVTDYDGELEIHYCDETTPFCSVRFWFRDGVVKDGFATRRNDTTPTSV